MLTALVVACIAQMPSAWQPRAHGSTFELTLPANAEQMRHAFTRPRGTQQLVWIPGVLHAPAQDVTLTEGPVRRLQVLPKKLGVILLLTGRNAAPLAAKTALLGTPTALLRVGPPMQPAAVSPIATAATPVAEAPSSLAMTPLADDAPHAWTQDNTFGMKPTTWVVWGAGCTFLLAMAYLLRQRAKPHEHGSIEIVAVRSLSARHKLTLVIAGGERLLLATTDKEVILLSHLGPAEAAETAQNEEAEETAQTGARVFKLPTQRNQKPAASAATSGSFAPDVLGLLRLQRPAVPA